MVEQTPTSEGQTFSLLYFVEQNRTMVEQNHTTLVEQTNNVTLCVNYKGMIVQAFYAFNSES